MTTADDELDVEVTVTAGDGAPLSAGDKLVALLGAAVMTAVSAGLDEEIVVDKLLQVWDAFEDRELLATLPAAMVAQ